MTFEKEFVVGRPREEVVADLDDDRTFAAFFPDTRVTRKSEHVRETSTPFRALGQSRDIRFVFETLPDGNVRFEKVCDGNVWRSLEGEVRLEGRPQGRTRVVLRMDGRTRTFVPEMTIRGPMRDQVEQMTRALRSRLETR